MCLEVVYHEEKTELGRQQAPGMCPYCGGKVSAVDIETKWLFCFLPLCFKVKRKYSCSSCDRRLVLYYWTKHIEAGCEKWRKKHRGVVIEIVFSIYLFVWSSQCWDFFCWYSPAISDFAKNAPSWWWHWLMSLSSFTFLLVRVLFIVNNLLLLFNKDGVTLAWTCLLSFLFI